MRSVIKIQFELIYYAQNKVENCIILSSYVEKIWLDNGCEKCLEKKRRKRQA